MSEKYQPSEEEITKAQQKMHTRQKEASVKREELAQGVDLELAKKCDFSAIWTRQRPSEEVVEYFHGTVDGKRIELAHGMASGSCVAKIDGFDLEDPEVAKKLWDKYAPIAKLIDHDQLEVGSDNDPDSIASQLLDL